MNRLTIDHLLMNRILICQQCVQWGHHSGTTRKKVNVEFDILCIINQLDKVSGIFKQNIVFLGAA